MRILFLLLFSILAFSEDRFILKDDCWNVNWSDGDTTYRTTAYVDSEILYSIKEIGATVDGVQIHSVETWAIPAVSITGMEWSLDGKRLVGQCKKDNWVLHGIGTSLDGKTTKMQQVNKSNIYFNDFGSEELAKSLKIGIEKFVIDFTTGRLGEKILGKSIDLRKTTDEANYPMFGRSYSWAELGIESRSVGRDDAGWLNFSRMFLNNTFNTKYIPVVNCEVFHIDPTRIKTISEPIKNGDIWNVIVRYASCDYFMMDKDLDPGTPEFAETRREGEMKLVFNSENDAAKSIEWMRKDRMQ